MALPSFGAIDSASIQAEFGGVNPIGIDEYYRNGPYITQNNINVPTSGPISFRDFYSSFRQLFIYVTGNITNINLQTVFGQFYPGSWTQNVAKKLVINSGVIVGATDYTIPAINIPTGLIGLLEIENNGSIQGAYGYANGGNGGNAIVAGSAVSINNKGTIYGGGGGGGYGGNGGTGIDATSRGTASSAFFNNCNDPCSRAFGNGQYPPNGSGGYCIGSAANTCYVTTFNPGIGNNVTYITCTTCYTDLVAIAGGTRGSGGFGQGYSVAATSAPTSGQTNGPTNGSAGSIGYPAGNGGTGGAGGTFGNPGANGNVGSNGSSTTAPLLGTTGGPGYGGLAGYYIVGNSNVTWIATGAANSRLGRVG